MKVEIKKSLRLRGEDGHELIVRHSNRGEPFREGIELDLMSGDRNTAYIFIDDEEAKQVRDLLNRLYPPKGF